VTTDFDNALADWHRADVAACEAEAASAVAGGSPAGADPDRLQAAARRLRRDADALLAELVRALHDGGEGTP
jgi:lambda repressor-like predicted transcriptional regulator